MMGSGGWGGTRRCRKIDGTNKGQDGLASTIVPARDIAPPVGGTRVFSSLISPPNRSSGCGGGGFPAEPRAVGPHAEDDHRHFARHHEHFAVHFPRPSNLYAPRFHP